jgi:uncharacterized membrane protein
MAAGTQKTIGNRLAPPRFLLFLAVFVASTAGWLGWRGIEAWRPAIMIGFDLAALAFFAATLPLLQSRSAAEMADHAARNDANRKMLLVITGAVMGAILVAIASEVLGVEEPANTKILVLATLTLAWLFSNLVYALHYAHLCYHPGGERQKGRTGFDFPGTKDPDYLDFVYFAFTLGMTFQTSDVTITSRAARNVVTVHCLAAFVFNLGVIAFTINVLGNR